MRASTLRLPKFILVLMIGLLATPIPALAEEHGPKSSAEHKAVARGLQEGIKALRRLGGQEETVRHLHELLRELRRHEVEARRSKASEARAKRKRGTEDAKRGPQAAKRDLAEMIEVMWMAQEVLRKEGREEHADILKRSVMALKVMWADRSDEEATDALLQAPGHKEQIKSLMLARKILAKHGDKRRAQAVSTLGKQLAKQGRPERRQKDSRKAKKATKKATKKRDAGERRGPQARRADDEKNAQLGELKDRLRVLRMAMPALREGERRDAAELLERAIHTAELLLEGRKDEKAQRIYRQTPDLSELSEVLHLAARLWIKFKHEKEAESVARLSRYYRERAQNDPELRAQAERKAKEAAEQEAQRARARTWAARQQAEMEEYREKRVHAQRRREHEKRVRELESRERRAREQEHHKGEHDHRHGEHDGRRAHKHEAQGDRIEDLRRELQEVQRALRALMRELHEIAKEHK